jgi:hypothetical protein
MSDIKSSEALTTKNAERLHKYIEVAKQCKWTQPLHYSDQDIVDSALHMALHNDTQIVAIYIVISWIPMLYTFFKKQLYLYIDKYGSETEHEELRRLKLKH